MQLLRRTKNKCPLALYDDKINLIKIYLMQQSLQKNHNNHLNTFHMTPTNKNSLEYLSKVLE